MNVFVQEMNKLENQNELSHSMLIRHHECTQDLEFRHLSAVHRLRRDQQQNQHQTEWTSQVDYNKRLEMELRKKHLFELKMQPKTLKVTKGRCGFLMCHPTLPLIQSDRGKVSCPGPNGLTIHLVHAVRNLSQYIFSAI